MSGWLNLCNTVPDFSRPGNRPILKFTKYVYQVLTYYKAGQNLSETRLSSDVCRDITDRILRSEVLDTVQYGRKTAIYSNTDV